MDNAGQYASTGHILASPFMSFASLAISCITEVVEVVATKHSHVFVEMVCYLENSEAHSVRTYKL